MNDAFAPVLAVVNQIDPIGVMDLASEDEYRHEVADIVARGSDVTAADVLTIFREWFYDGVLTQDQAEQIAAVARAAA